ncbi:MAG: radical SAM protein [Acidobacteriota bacterium]
MPNYENHPIVMWEVTRACDLHCRTCTIGASEARGPNELSTYEAYKTIDQIATLAPRELIMTGGDPLEREDVAQIINYARRRGLEPGLVVSPTSQLTADAVADLQRSGLTRIIFSIDGPTEEIHEGVRGAPGTFAATLRAIRWAETAGLTIEVNTLVLQRSVARLTAIADLIRPLGISRWNLYFPVPLVASTRTEMLTAEQTELAFATLEEIRGIENFQVRVVEAPHYRRYRLQRDLEASLHSVNATRWPDFTGYQADDAMTQKDLMDSAVDGARGLVFISHAGDVRASEFLLLSAGNLRYRPLGAIYRSSDLFVALRDAENLKGRCGRCEFRQICGGSRARAWALEGNIFADDPLCAYQPGVPMPFRAAAPLDSEASS